MVASLCALALGLTCSIIFAPTLFSTVGLGTFWVAIFHVWSACYPRARLEVKRHLADGEAPPRSRQSRDWGVAHRYSFAQRFDNREYTKVTVPQRCECYLCTRTEYIL
jgi:hypothetical protein